MPEIESFSEIGRYMDQLVRVYSSGMQVRLAFSVATVVRPDVLIVDEALSVGDAYFQHKSFERIREYRKQGTTLLIVSHDKQSIQSICDRALLLNAGQLVMEGSPEAVMDYYNAMLADHQSREIRQVINDSGRLQTISGNGEASLTEVSLLDDQGQVLDVVSVGQMVTLRVVVKCNVPLPELVLGYMIKDRLGQAVFGTNTYHHGQSLENLAHGQSLEFLISFQVNLGPGTYSIALAAHSQDTHLMNNYEWRDQALILNVINTNKQNFVGTAWLPPTIEVQS